VWEGFEQDFNPDDAFVAGKNLRRDVLARLHSDDATAGWEKAIAALRERGSRPQLVFLHSTLPHGPWRFLPDGRQYPTPGNGYLGLARHVWSGPQWQIDQEFQRHVLQVQYTDRLLGRLLDVVPDDAVLVVTADHGSAFVSREPKRQIDPRNAGVIAPVPFFVRLPGQERGRVDDRAVRTMDVLPTIAKAAGISLPWKAQGVPADERPVDPDAAIDVFHQNKYVLTESLSSIEAKRRERDVVEEELLRDGIYGIGPRPDLLGRSAAGEGRTISVDPESPLLPSFITGRAPPGSVLAVAVNGRIAQTTRTYDGDQYAALVPPSSLHAGENTVATFVVLPTGELRPLR
jgi:Sulfatase